MICLNLFSSNRDPSCLRWQILSMVPTSGTSLCFFSHPSSVDRSACVHPVLMCRRNIILISFFCANKRRRHLITVSVSNSCAWDMRPLEFRDLNWTAPAGRVIIVLFALILVLYRANICIPPLASGADSRTLMETVCSLTPLLKWWLDQNGNILLQCSFSGDWKANKGNFLSSTGFLFCPRSKFKDSVEICA